MARRAVAEGGPGTPAEIARRIPGAPRPSTLAKMLAVLDALGQVRSLPGGRYAA